MTLWRTALIGLGLITTLVACDEVVDENTTFGQTIETLNAPGADEFSQRFINLLQVPDTRALQVGFISGEPGGTLLLEREKNGFEFWLSPDNAQFILQDGIVTGTRGFGEGLLASELSETRAKVLSLQGGYSDRFHTYLDGNDRAVTRTYRCLVEADTVGETQLASGPVRTRIMKESCRSLDQEFVNVYWVEIATRQIVQSRQWLGPYVGAISTRVVK